MWEKGQCGGGARSDVWSTEKPQGVQGRDAGSRQCGQSRHRLAIVLATLARGGCTVFALNQVAAVAPRAVLLAAAGPTGRFAGVGDPDGIGLATAGTVFGRGLSVALAVDQAVAVAPQAVLLAGAEGSEAGVASSVHRTAKMAVRAIFMGQLALQGLWAQAGMGQSSGQVGSVVGGGRGQRSCNAWLICRGLPN